jgi:putative oligomerization/nucleic acid binding protein
MSAFPLKADIERRNHSTRLEVLEERYARGEISREEYLQKKRNTRPSDRLRKRVGTLLKLQGCW